MGTKRKGCARILAGTCALIVLVAITIVLIDLADHANSADPPAKTDFGRPVFVRQGAAACDQIEQHRPDLIEGCGTFGAQRVQVLQTAHDGRMYKVAPYSLPRDTAEAVAGWTYYTNLHN